LGVLGRAQGLELATWPAKLTTVGGICSPDRHQFSALRYAIVLRDVDKKLDLADGSARSAEGVRHPQLLGKGREVPVTLA